MMLTVTPVRAFKDNYIWLIHATHGVAIVDPGDARPVLDHLKNQALTPIAILITHHHWDHTGGVHQLLEHYPDLSVYGPANPRIGTITHPLNEGMTVMLEELNAHFQVLEIPGHTMDHIAYYGEGMLFCGDTLFGAGCGRLFEGTPELMHKSLSKLAALPGDTSVYCGHEYTLDNIAFAKWVEPDNVDLLKREKDTQGLRQQNIPSIPSQLDLERRTNPFLRFDVPPVIQAAENFAKKSLQPGAETFGVVRFWKDSEFD